MRVAPGVSSSAKTDGGVLGSAVRIFVAKPRAFKQAFDVGGVLLDIGDVGGDVGHRQQREEIGDDLFFVRLAVGADFVGDRIGMCCVRCGDGEDGRGDDAFHVCPFEVCRSVVAFDVCAKSHLPLAGRSKSRHAISGGGPSASPPHPTCSLRCARRPPHQGEVGATPCVDLPIKGRWAPRYTVPPLTSMTEPVVKLECGLAR